MWVDVLGYVYYGIVLVVLFGVTIFVHELGHFLLAVRMGMVVDTFSIGFGPALWKRTVRGVTYKIGCIPVGGYVALPQLDPAGMSTLQGKRNGQPVADAARTEPSEDAGAKCDRALPPIAPWKKIVVSLSGAAGNLILAVGLAWAVYLSPHAITDQNGALVGFVATNSPAYAAGLRAGDQVLSVNGEPVEIWSDFVVECHLGGGSSNAAVLTVRSGGAVRTLVVPTRLHEGGLQGIEGIEKAMLCVITDVLPGGPAERAGIRTNDIVRSFAGVNVVGSQHLVDLVASQAGRNSPIVVERNGKPLEVSVRPEFNAEKGRALIGVAVGSGRIMVMPWMQYRKPLAQLAGDARGIARILRALVSRKEGEAKRAAGALGGPIMILATLWVSIQSSFLNALGFLRFLNVNLAVLNLLPIPVLDGGHILFSLWKSVSRRRVHARVVNVLVNVFAALLIAAILLISARDVPRVLKLFWVPERDDGSLDRTQALPDPGTNGADRVPAGAPETP